MSQNCLPEGWKEAFICQRISPVCWGLLPWGSNTPTKRASLGYSITRTVAETLQDKKLDSWYKPEMRHCQHRTGWNLPRAVHQSHSWNWRWKRWEAVHRRHLWSLENVLLALSKSSLLSIICSVRNFSRYEWLETEQKQSFLWKQFMHHLLNFFHNLKLSSLWIILKDTH